VRRVLEVRRQDIRTSRGRDVDAGAVGNGEGRFAVERFGLTANNVTYALLGERLRYWSFFPADEAGWGRVPAWGFARAVESRCAGVPEGTRVFGYLPMGGELVLTPRVERGRLHDLSPHRAELPAVYNAYRVAEPDDRDDATMVLQPLFATSVLLAGSLAGAERVLFASASSKTALGTAYLLSQRGVEVAGITGSSAFAAGLGVYAELVGYEAIDELERRPTTFVDLAGNASVRAAVHRHLGGGLRASILVGATHVDAPRRAAEPLPGPEPTFFFAPDHVGDGLEREARAAYAALLAWSESWLAIERREGPAAVAAAWADAVAGRLPPAGALSLSLQ
jgi:hypothetical protein